MLRYYHPEAIIEIWAQDELRLGLQPVTRKIWALKGHRPIAKLDRKYQWLYCYGFVRPLTGDNFWTIMPRVDTEIMSLSLREFADYHNPQRNKIIILLVDQAGWHITKKLDKPKNIRFFPIPSHTPELQPAECMWPLVKECVANESFDDLDELESVVVPRCKWLIDNPEIVKGEAGFEWLRQIEYRTD